MSRRPGRRLRDTQGSPWASSSCGFSMPVKGFWIFPSEAEQAQLRAPGWRGVTHSASGGGSRSSQRGELTPFLLGQLRHHLGAARSGSTPATGPCLLCVAGPDASPGLHGVRLQVPEPSRPPATPASPSSAGTDPAAPDPSEGGESPVVQSDEEGVEVDTALATLHTDDSDS